MPSLLHTLPWSSMELAAWLVLGTDPVHDAAAMICLSRPLIVCACIDDKDFIIEVV